MVQTGTEARARLTTFCYAILLADFSLPDMTAATLLGSVSHLPQPPAIIIMRGHRLDMVQDMVIDQPQVTYLEKPFAMEALYAALATCQRPGEPRERGAPSATRPS